ncbi:MAG: hypothetical protein CL943_02195 [Candidatus Diapherotrites archaeon]|uniref:Copper resistance protein D domain-containing protein n=1 Tax=Candidatus Iainarchaeum sp. TaxID=3101447 RepID=A0A2D6M0Z7_9ARCH|nr:hypothetical protein [Candidatus Diapherotrites archaeon]|tara:strand:- start:771 stop:1229 length:459 start_codon:yes stop_codon:yes gene_type:complete
MASIEFLTAHFFHIVFLAWGVGGVTIAMLLSIKADKEPDLGPAVMRLMPSISKLIWVGLIGLAVTGIVTTSMGLGKGFFDENLLLIKHILVVLIVIAGLNLTFRLIPKMKALVPKPGAAPSAEFLSVKKQMKITSMASLILWYAVVVLSVAL